MNKTDRKEVEDLIACGVDQGIWKVFFFIFWVYLAVIFFDVVTFKLFQWGADSTDTDSARSGMAIKTDNKTGCEYLVTGNGGITPRLDREGYQMGCK